LVSFRKKLSVDVLVCRSNNKCAYPVGTALVKNQDQYGDRLTDRSGQPLRVLIVEDEMLTALDFTTAIEDAGAQVLATASSAMAAEALARSLHPDAILMDVRLAGNSDGVDAARAIRAFSNVPIIFVTGNSDRNTRERISTIETSVLISKPAEPSALIAALSQSADRWARWVAPELSHSG
jgi:two-component system, response regulator PdtaR